MSGEVNGGVSRVSGRVRKKTVKLIEMEDLPPIEPVTSHHHSNKKSPAPTKLKIVIGGKEVTREVAPAKSPVVQNKQETPKLLLPIKFRLNTSSGTTVFEESPSPAAKKAKLTQETPTISEPQTVQTIIVPSVQAKNKMVTVNVKNCLHQPMTTPIKAQVTPAKSTSKSKTAPKSTVNSTTKTPVQKKPEKRRHVTAYTLWSRENRSIIQQDHPDLDFAGVSKRMGEVWQHLSNSEKTIWKIKAQKETGTPVGTMISTSSSRNSSSKSSSSSSSTPAATVSKSKKSVTKSTNKSVSSKSNAPPVPICSPIRMAAHLKILGESLDKIGKQLSQSQKSTSIVHGNQLSLLLDTALCSLGPLLALTTLDSRLDGCPRNVHHKILDDISYIMPNI